MPRLAKTFLLILVFLLPWQTRYFFYRGQAGGFEFEAASLVIYATELLLWLAVLCSLPKLLSEIKQSWEQKDKWRILARQNFSFIILLLFIVWSGLSIAWSITPIVAYWRWFKLLEAIVLASLLFIWQVDFLRIAIAMAWSGSLQSCLAFGQLLTQSVGANKWLGLASQSPADLGVAVIENGGRYLRAYGSWPHPNMLGGWLAVSLWLTVYWLSQVQSRAGKILVSGLLILQSFGLVLSFSRSAILALAVTVVAALIIWQCKRQKLLGGWLILVALVTALLSVWPLWSSRVNLNNRLEEQSISNRQAIITQAATLIRECPLLGWGLGNYQLAWQAKFPNQPAYQYQPAHNLWLLAAGELGLIGLLLLGGLFFAGWRAVWHQPFISLTFLLVFILSLFDHYFWTNWPLLAIFWLLLSISKNKKALAAFIKNSS
jgi:O-antigen ligase